MAKITIIIPTYNRPHCLKRILNYYDSFIELPKEAKMKDDFEFVVADSSSDENKKRNQEVISALKNFKVLRFNDYPEDINPWYKFADAVNYAKSEFCLICSDDDFVTPEGIIKSAAFLEKNFDFSVCQGKYLIFSVDPQNRDKNKIRLGAGYICESLTLSDAKDRVSYYLADYQIPTFSAVHRTALLKMILTETAKFTNDNRFGELLPSLLAVTYSKMKCLDIPYAFLETSAHSTGVTTCTIRSFIKDGSYDEKYANFKNCLAMHLTKNSKLNTEEANETIDKAMSEYLAKNYPDGIRYFLINKIKNVLNFLPVEMLQRIKTISAKINFWRLKNKYLDSAEYHKDFNKIKDYLITESALGGRR
ncbi:MAG: TIGR00180 family glycosyltransferase [bacterium]|nr:TIGR00180 family glycosyltransferase [bacterium]